MASMKRILPLIIFIFSSINVFSQKIVEGQQANQLINGASMIRYVEHRTAPDYIQLSKTMDLQFDRALPWVHDVLGLKSEESLALNRVEKDQLNMIHYMYQHTIGGIPVEGSGYRLHTLNNRVVSMNGEFYKDIQISTSPVINSSAAIQSALNFVGADTYKWELPVEESFIKRTSNDPSATFAPQPELVIAAKNGNYKKPEFRLCWKMDIYAHQPMSRKWVYVDATSGEVIWDIDRICHVDAPGTATTVFSGSRPIVSDFTAGSYRLREAGRGNGVETYNLAEGTVYGNAVDFTDADNNWNNVNAQLDQYATDAHWGAEMTYDYYMNVHSRNSINGNGFALLSYVHYDVGYGNAFWDGSRMTYGDGGSGSFNEPLTTIDITGHEITHGLTTFTADLVYQDESGALNESFSDIFGVTIDNFARGTTGTPLWRMGEECTTSGNGIRLMSNPNAMGDPDTYTGTNWYTGTADNGGVHTNSGVQNYWYYLMCQGGSGTNDLGNAFTVAAVGMADAADIAFRNLTVYLSDNSQYADSRFYAILSAQDLFGGCTPQVQATTNAWYAVGVGPAYVASVTADFSPSATSLCSAPASIQFTNMSNNGVTYTWYFGDGGNSTQTNPSHTYGANGTYNVSLAADGGLCGTDSIMYTALININIPASPSATDVTYCQNPSIATLNATGAGVLHWYATPVSTVPLFVGNPYITAPISTTTTFYVEDQIPNGVQNVGPATNAFGTGGNHNNTSTQYLEFTVNQPITLNSVFCYAGGAGNRNIELWDGVGTLINTYPTNIPAGNSTVTLNINLQPGNYRIGGTEMDLYRNNSGASYPYSLAGLVDITGSSAGGGFYYYFYDWEISSSCTSARTPVTVNIAGPSASFTYNSSGTVVTFTNTSANAIGYFWDFGGGNTSTLQNPSFDFGGVGTFPVTLIVNNNGCYDTLVTTVTITDAGMEDIDFISSVFPNPFSDYITLSMQLPASGNELTIEAYNTVGQKIQRIYHGVSVGGQFTYTWNTPANLAPGVYLIKVTYNGKQSVKQVVKY